MAFYDSSNGHTYTSILNCSVIPVHSMKRKKQIRIVDSPTIWRDKGSINNKIMLPTFGHLELIDTLRIHKGYNKGYNKDTIRIQSLYELIV